MHRSLRKPTKIHGKQELIMKIQERTYALIIINLRLNRKLNIFVLQ